MKREKITREETIDATGQSLGRLSSQIAKVLMGKDDVAYQPHLLADVSVTVTNASKLNIPFKTLKSKNYIRYTGYPGGRRSIPIELLIERFGYSEVIRRAVYGMLPSNKLRSKMLKNLTIQE